MSTVVLPSSAPTWRNNTDNPMGLANTVRMSWFNRSFFFSLPYSFKGNGSVDADFHIDRIWHLTGHSLGDSTNNFLPEKRLLFMQPFFYSSFGKPSACSLNDCISSFVSFPYITGAFSCVLPDRRYRLLTLRCPRIIARVSLFYFYSMSRWWDLCSTRSTILHSRGE